MQTVAIAVQRSKNPKLGRCSATYACQQSCPSGCVHRGRGCYGEHGVLGRFTTDRLNDAGTNLMPDARDIARAEAREIGKLKGNRPLRLHTVGDCRTASAAMVVAAAAEKYMAKDGQPVWTYTHAHDVPREAWGMVSVLRSCESMAEVRQAHADGYATALVIKSPELCGVTSDGFRLVWCPAQASTRTCDTCTLCFRDQRLRHLKVVICFTPHGAGADLVEAWSGKS